MNSGLMIFTPKGRGWTVKRICRNGHSYLLGRIVKVGGSFDFVAAANGPAIALSELESIVGHVIDMTRPNKPRKVQPRRKVRREQSAIDWCERVFKLEDPRGNQGS